MKKISVALFFLLLPVACSPTPEASPDSLVIGLESAPQGPEDPNDPLQIAALLSDGTGPYRLEAWIPNERISLVRNEDYPGEKPRIRRILIRVIPDPDTRVMEFMSGRVHLLPGNVPPPLVEFARQKNFGLVTTDGTRGLRLVFRLQGGPTESLAVRKAIAHALDLPALVASHLAGLGQPAAGFLPQGHWAFQPATTRYPFNPRQARSLLDEAGYPDPDQAGPRVRFTLRLHAEAENDRMAHWLARSLREIGIDLKRIAGPCAGDFDLCLAANPPGEELETLRTGRNGNGYSNPILDKLLEATVAQPRNQEILSLIQKILMQDLPQLPLVTFKNFALFSPRLQGVRIRPDGGLQSVVELEWKQR